MQLSQDSIINAAVAILNEFGLSDMTMRRVAKQLNVAPGALYWHFKNKQELIDATSRHLLAPLLEAGVDGSQQTRTARETCVMMRELMLATKDGAEVVSAALSNQALREELEATLSSSSDGVDSVGAFTLLHFVVGAVLTEQTQVQLQAITGENSDLDDFETRFNTGVEIVIAGQEAVRHIR
ncbi:TetR family transcriptional regulator [Corynebacterium deserti]|uniref:TetR family transcriptional regulator n=1 Tax=Corynebacterium deserti TaxID=1408191 RepID=UPI001E601CBF|nr:TetR family transcriptional regulator [Corynebacterium deserti]